MVADEVEWQKENKLNTLVIYDIDQYGERTLDFDERYAGPKMVPGSSKDGDVVMLYDFNNDRYKIAGVQEIYMKGDEVARVDYITEPCPDSEDRTELCMEKAWVEWHRIESGGDPDYATAFPTRAPTPAPVHTPMPTWPDDIVRSFPTETCTSSQTANPTTSPTRAPSELAPLCTKRDTFDMGYGGCETYAEGGVNASTCKDDCMVVTDEEGTRSKGVCALEACQISHHYLRRRGGGDRDQHSEGRRILYGRDLCESHELRRNRHGRHGPNDFAEGCDEQRLRSHR